MLKLKNVMPFRLAIGLALTIIAVLLTENSYALILYLIGYLILGYDVLMKAFKNIFKGHLLDENFLMSIATLGAFFIGEYTEGVAVMLFYQVGELFQKHAVNKSRKSIGELMDIRPDYANLIKDGQDGQVDPYDVLIGDLILIKPGEKVPLDCIIIKGNSTVDQSALTGESLPIEVSADSLLLSGSVNMNGLIVAKVTQEYTDSTVNRILDLVESASDHKSKAENFITKFARYYTPIVVSLAVILATVPPILFSGSFNIWFYRSLSFLVVSCPCALVISIPLSFFGGIGAASKLGILIKGSNYLEALADADTIIFDKTGTITKGIFKVKEICPINIEKKELLELATIAEHYSSHPISNALKKACDNKIDTEKMCEYQEIAGHGISVKIDGKRTLVGNKKLMEDYHIDIESIENIIGTIVYVAQEQCYLGHILIADEIKEDSLEAISKMKKSGINQTIMLTGDNHLIGMDVANKLSIHKVYTDLLPTDKVNITEEILSKSKNKVIFVGDGINDAPVLARADIGIAMGNIGSDAAIEAADIVIMNDELTKIATAIELSKDTLKIVKQNILFALGIKILVLILTVFGLSNMWEAVFADVGVSVLAILNACRMLNIKKYTH
ncbi:MAG: heavy metal translocating P-type ATPase [Erysipelotrichaceae bacterium]